jgi:uncharacterized protein
MRGLGGAWVSKLLLIIMVFAVAWWVLGKYRRTLKHGEVPRPAKSEDMIRCEQCGVHLPRSEGYASHGKFFCSEEHSRLHG